VNLQQDNLINNITSNQQATHGQVVSNSIGMVILKLVKIYLGNNPSQADFDQMHAKSIDILSNLKAADFIKSEDSGNEDILAETTKITNELPALIAYIIQRMQEPIHPQLDIVTLYLIDEKGTPYQQKIELLLKKVFPLMLFAYIDDSKFTHNYAGTYNENLLKATADRPHRLLSMFKSLQRSKLGLCHTGIRHELVLLLNKVYKDVDLIEDAAAHSSYMLKGKIGERYAAKIDKLPQEQLKAALITWMTEQNPTTLLALLDQNHEIEAEILGSFALHGCDPNNLHVKYDGELIPVQALIMRLTSQISFSLDRANYGALYMVEFILNANPKAGETLESQALTKIQTWIRNTFQLDLLRHNKAIARFYSVYKSHQQLLTYHALLHITGGLPEDGFSNYLQLFNNYFQQILNGTGDNIPAPSSDTLTAIDELQKIIKTSRNDNLTDRIENFFILWNDALKNRNLSTLRTLYAMVLNEHMSRKILLTDSEIMRLMQLHTDTVDGQLIKHISPYEINRIFLSALLVKPCDWTPLFATTLDATLTFVKEMSGETAQTLKANSYPQKLIAQLNYLINLQKNGPSAQLVRPEPIIILPRHLQNAAEWIVVSMWLNDSQFVSFYTILQAKLRPMLVSDYVRLINTTNPVNHSYGKALFHSVPKSHQTAFFLAVIKYIFQQETNYSVIFSSFSHENISIFREALIADNDTLKNIKNIKQLKIVLNILATDQYSDFLDIVGREKLRVILESSSKEQFRSLVMFFNSKGVREVVVTLILFELLCDKLGASFTKQHPEFYSSLNQARFTSLLESMDYQELITEIKESKFNGVYRMLLKCLPEERYVAVFNNPEVLEKLGIEIILRGLPKENINYFFEIISNDNLKLCFKTLGKDALKTCSKEQGLAYCLNPDSQVINGYDLLNALGNKLQVLINDVNAIVYLINYYCNPRNNSAMLPEVFHKLGDDNLYKIATPLNLFVILCKLNPITFCNIFEKLSAKLRFDMLQTESNLDILNARIVVAQAHSNLDNNNYPSCVPLNIISKDKLQFLWEQRQQETKGLFRNTQSKAACDCYAQARSSVDNLQERLHILVAYAKDESNQSDSFYQQLNDYFDMTDLWAATSASCNRLSNPV
jgi:hypothetical protein